MSNREWIAEQFSKGIEAEHHMSLNARVRVDDPPIPDLAVLYGQIAEADERHRDAVEAIAIRYGHPPSKGARGGIGETIGRLREKVTNLGSSPMDEVAHDLGSKSDAIHWMAAWVHGFEAVGDPQSSRELAAILAEERSHHEALQVALNRQVAAGAGAGASETSESPELGAGSAKASADKTST